MRTKKNILFHGEEKRTRADEKRILCKFTLTTYLYLEKFSPAQKFSNDSLFLWLSSSSCSLNLIIILFEATSREYHRKAFYQRMQKLEQGASPDHAIRAGA